MSQVQTGVVELKSANAPALKGDDTSSFTPVQFPKPFPNGSKVIVITETQTFHGPDTPGIRLADVTPAGFKIRINELVGSSGGKENQAMSNGIHVAERIGWVAYAI
ncbi:hypothetical protein [Chelativorans salis]|uniref:Uncharacterized protein n=1 Tax=Chelativorans salis TaxID=2978478 RepID=A0ABT2LTV4_9HYPH|nr:hypothetical protein [Chelativorans sp. EGI FJ00035]MCT7377962.1 hypothetical protein [Chelativorans sp. EGI FJ00035]